MNKSLQRPSVYLAIFLLASSGCQTGSSVTPSQAGTQTVAASETPSPTVTPTEVPREPAGPQAGSEMLYADGSTLIFVPSGEFQMGGGGKDNRVHTVSLSSYWIQKTEVTRRMYAMCLSARECTPVIDKGTGGYISDSAYLERPMTGITWDQAQSYCGWIGGRLPSEAQWEKAAGGAGGKYPWGEAEPACDLLNFEGCLGGGVARANSYHAGKSAFGVLDLAGNAREWVNDIYAADYYQNSSAQDPPGPPTGNYRVVRGGGPDSPAAEVTIFDRDLRDPRLFSADLGFRCVVPAPPGYAPYCKASPILDRPAGETEPQDRCEPFITVLTCKAQHLTGQVSPGNLVRVETSPQMDYQCRMTGPSTLQCTGVPILGSVPVTACVRCASGAGVSPAELACPLNYTSQELGGYCNYSGGPIADYCPSGSVPLNENQCVYQVQQVGGCPAGSYLDTGLNACVTIARTGQDCLSGVNYSFGETCCQAPVSDEYYPVCRPDEYYSYEFGCVPLPGPDGIESCTTNEVPRQLCK